MGQRLVVDLIQNDKVVAAIYYHWSAYFASTVMELANLSKTILKAEKENKNKLLSIVEMLEEEEDYPDLFNKTMGKRRGGVRGVPEDLEAAKALFPDHEFKTENVDRNCGIISFSEEGIKSCHDWEEGHADINLDTHEITNNVDLDPYPFEFVDVEYEEEDGEEYISCLYSGKIRINESQCNIDAFDCTCETIQELADFLDVQYKIWKERTEK